MGWLIFKERDIQDKLIASCVMVTGALMFYIPISLGAAALLALAVVIGMFVFFFFTPEKQKVELKPEPAQVDS
jgi:membrane protein CcdC involved in cytochrome C biogenesis